MSQEMNNLLEQLKSLSKETNSFKSQDDDPFSTENVDSFEMLWALEEELE